MSDLILRPGYRPYLPAEPIGGSVKSYPAGKIGEFLANAQKYLGQPYLWGGGHSSKTGIMRVDCSGLVLQAARLSGLNLDGTAAMQQRMGSTVSMSALKPGDLLFHGNPASHVGIYLGNGKAIHAPRTGDVVKIVDLSSYTYFDNARRVFDGEGAPATPTSAIAADSLSTSSLRKGAKGAAVSELQNALKRQGFDPGPVDGDFGPKTDAAVRAFQAAKGLTVDGIVGPKTRAALAAAAAPAPATPTPAAPALGGTVTSQPGDTLFTIAQRLLGDGSRWQELYDANRDQLVTPHLLYPGTTLKLPTGASPTAGTATPAPASGLKQVLDGLRAQLNGLIQRLTPQLRSVMARMKG